MAAVMPSPADDHRPPPPGVPVLDLDPYDDATLESPFALHAAVRAAGPIAWLSRYQVYVIGRHAEIVEVLRDWARFSSTGGSGLADIRKPGAWRAPSPIVEADPPDHTRVRGAMQRVLSPALIRQWREDFASRADAFVADLLDRPEIDGVHDLAEAFVAEVFPASLGLRPTPDQRENLYLLGALNFDGQGPRNARYLETQARADRIADWYDRSLRRESLVPGGFGDRIYAAADAGEIEPSTAPLLVRSFVRGGLDTTASTIAAALMHLAADPAQWARLRADPTLAKAAFEEAMRLETPIQTVNRLTMGAVEVGGVPVEADRKILVLLGSANRDPAFWDRPDAFDLARSTLGHLALGTGIHACVGQMMARLEGEALLRAVATRVATLEPAGPPERRLNNNLRSLAHLPLRWTAA
jgi:4-methoxybenzoate monooxygenase (O-demethylating)